MSHSFAGIAVVVAFGVVDFAWPQGAPESLQDNGPLYLTASLVGSGNTPSNPPFPSILRGIRVQDLSGSNRGGCSLATGIRSEGGTAYDPRVQGVWIADGPDLKLIRLRDCSLQTSTPVFLRLLGARVSGLAFDPLQERLYQLETTSNRCAITVYDARTALAGTPPTVIGSCTERIFDDVQHVQANGLEFDPGRRLLYIGFNEAVAGVVHRYLGVSRLVNPCRPDTILGLPSAVDSLTGLAMDSRRNTLYVSTAFTIEAYSLGSAPTPAAPVLAGSVPTRYDYNGLAFIPTWQRLPIGTSCTGTGCAACPAMEAGTYGGDPVPGNRTFGLDLVNAPTGLGLVALGLGSCSTGQPLDCGMLYLPSGSITASVSLVGPACAARGMFPLPVPPVLPLGITLCAQWAVVCSSAPDSTALSNAVQVTVAYP